MSTSLLQVSVPEIQDGVIVYRGELRAPGRPAHAIEFHASVPSAPADVPIRAFLFAFLVPAMRLGTALQLPGPIDAVTAANVMEWQEALASWRPHQLRVVPIYADIVPSSPRTGGPGGAITAFSGGVDSCFTVLRHTSANAAGPWRHTALRAGLMVHGFDIPLAQPEVFASAWVNSEALLARFGLQAYQLRTNVRGLQAAFGCDWETEAHGIWLAAALACYEPWFDRVLIPATYAYPKLRFPWGSNPVTDPLFRSDRVDYWHDGAAFTKFTKVRALASEPGVTQRVRVCWQGEQLDRNCGRCFKCIATQVCFWLAGVPAPAAFPQQATLTEVARLPIKNEENAYLVRSLQTAAAEQGRRELATTLGGALRRAAWIGAARDLKRRAVARLGSGRPVTALLG